MSKRKGTILGVIALVLWSTTTAGSKILLERIDPYVFVAISSSFAGVFLILYEFWKDRKYWENIRQIPLSSFLKTGFFFILYFACFNISIKELPDRSVVYQLNLLNYLWPPLTFVLSPFILRTRVNWTILAIGLMLGVIGVVVSTVDAEFGTFEKDLFRAIPSCVFMLVAAVSWAFYTNFTKQIPETETLGVVPILQLVTGVLMGVFGLTWGEPSVWDTYTIVILILMTVGPVTCGYLFWDIGTRKGNKTRLTSLAFGLPIMSTIVLAGLGLGNWTGMIAIAAVFLTLGAVICYKSEVKE